MIKSLALQNRFKQRLKTTIYRSTLSGRSTTVFSSNVATSDHHLFRSQQQALFYSNSKTHQLLSSQINEAKINTDSLHSTGTTTMNNDVYHIRATTTTTTTHNDNNRYRLTDEWINELSNILHHHNNLNKDNIRIVVDFTTENTKQTSLDDEKSGDNERRDVVYLCQNEIHLLIPCHNEHQQISIEFHGEEQSKTIICCPKLSIGGVGQGNVHVSMNHMSWMSSNVYEKQRQRKFQQRLIMDKDMVRCQIVGSNCTFSMLNSEWIGHFAAEGVDRVEIHSSQINRFDLVKCKHVYLRDCVFGNLQGEGYQKNDLRLFECTNVLVIDNTVWYSTLSLESLKEQSTIESNRIRTTRPGIRVSHCMSNVNIKQNNLFDAGILVNKTNSCQIQGNRIYGVECGLKIHDEPTEQILVENNEISTKPCIDLTNISHSTNKVVFEKNKLIPPNKDDQVIAGTDERWNKTICEDF